MDQIQTRFAKYSSYSYAAERQEAPGAACNEKKQRKTIDRVGDNSMQVVLSSD